MKSASETMPLIDQALAIADEIDALGEILMPIGSEDGLELTTAQRGGLSTLLLGIAERLRISADDAAKLERRRAKEKK